MDALPCGLHIGDPRRTTFKEWSSNCNLCVEHWNIPLSRSWRESQRWEIFFLRRNIPMDGQFWCRESGQVEDLKHFLSSQRTLFRRGIFFLPVMKGKKLFWKRKFCYFSSQMPRPRAHSSDTRRPGRSLSRGWSDQSAFRWTSWLWSGFDLVQRGERGEASQLTEGRLRSREEQERQERWEVGQQQPG